MKKILLASTILVGSASFAAAQSVSFSGSAYMGIGTIDQGTNWIGMATAKLNVAMSGETDGGLMFGADFTIKAGTATAFTYTTAPATTALGVIVPGSATYLLSSLNTGGVGEAKVWISGDFGKVSLAAHDGVVGDQYNTLAYSGTFGAFSIKADYDFSHAGPPPAPEDGDWFAQIGYDFGDYDVYFKQSYDASGTLNISKIGGSGTFGDFTVKASYEVDDFVVARSGWDVGVDWSSGAISVGANIGMDRTTQLDTLGLTASYDLGGGASVDFSYNDLDTATNGAGTEKMMLGVSMDF